MAEKKDNVAVKFKDNVFCMIYRDKKNLLELYNALNNSNYEDVDALEVTTLNGGSYMKYKNDASFLLSMNLYMFEQQSSKNPNMPLRFLHYLSDVYREMYSNDLFHTKIGVKLCSMAGGGVSRNLWNFFRTAPAGTGQAVTCSTSGMGLRLK